MNPNLYKYAAIGGFACVFIGKAYESQITTKLKKEQYYKEAMNRLNEHPASESLLGKPIGVGTLDVFSGKNYADSKLAKIYVPLKGSKSKGELFIKAEKSYENYWVTKRIELEIKDEQGGKLLIYDSDRELI